jgi:lysozyme
MKTSLAGQQFIKSFETLQLECYDDGSGNNTIGWGHKIKPGEEILIHGITTDQAQQLFELDLMQAEKIVRSEIGNVVNQNQFDSLVSFAFNTGKMSATLKVMIHTSASENAIRNFWQAHYITSDSIKFAGLVRRRKAESENYFKIKNAIT